MSGKTRNYKVAYRNRHASCRPLRSQNLQVVPKYKLEECWAMARTNLKEKRWFVGEYWQFQGSFLRSARLCRPLRLHKFQDPQKSVRRMLGSSRDTIFKEKRWFVGENWQPHGNFLGSARLYHPLRPHKSQDPPKTARGRLGEWQER